MFLIIAVVGSLILLSAKTSQTVVKHHGYATYYNPDKREPDSVSWDLTADMLCPDDKPRLPFAADPDIVDCPGSNAYDDPLDGIKYSQGHMFNFDEAKCDETDRRECFYMSNMLPQNQHLNAGDWASVEHQERKWAAKGKIHIVAGGMGSLGTLPSGVNVPDSCWKAIYHDHQWDGYIMANRSTSHGHRLASHVASFKDFERRTGFHPSSQ
jgi:endonuclease G